MTFPVPGGAAFLRARSNLADVASPAAALADLGGLGLAATTGPAGFTLVNATPNILTWAAPNDGNMHRLLLVCEMHVTSLLTGGQIDVTLTAPDGFSATVQLIAASSAAGLVRITSPVYLIQAGSTFTVQQFTAATAGAAVLWAEIWAL